MCRYKTKTNLSSVEEPSSDLTKLADLQGIASSKVEICLIFALSAPKFLNLIILLYQVKYLALAQENVPLAMELLETAFIRGQWLIFQVCPMYDTIKPQIPECGFGAQLPPSVGQANPGERP